MAVINGTAGDDTLEGAAGTDWLYGLAGNDVLEGGAGADLINGGAGSDTAAYTGSNAGVDVNLATARGAGGHAQGDVLTGIENLAGSNHRDTLTGDDGDNRLWGGAGDDIFYAGAGDDTLEGGAGHDYFSGDIGNDTLTGGTGNDTLYGGAGNDILEGGAGADTLDGGYAHPTAAGKFDTASYKGSDSGVTVYLATGTARGGHAEGDVLRYIENLIGSGHNDYLAGNSGNNHINGLSGDDAMDGGAGADTLDAGEGGDVLSGGTGADHFIVGAGTDTINDFRAGEGDTLEFRFDINDAHVDVRLNYVKITHGANSVKIQGKDHQWYDELLPSAEYVARYPFSAIVADGTVRDVSGDTDRGNFRDHLIAYESGSALRGKKGRDYLEGSDGRDFLVGGNARDWLTGGRGGDRLQGGKQDDILTGGTGRDKFIFRTDHGKDIVTDFSVGRDTLELHGAGFPDLTIKKWAKGTGVRVEWDEGTIYLEGVQKDALTEASFAFVAPAPEPGAETPEAPAYTPVARVPESTDGLNRIQADNSRRDWGGDTNRGNLRDHLIADSGGSALRGKKGRDYLEGAGGDDFLSGGTARDWLVGGRGGDRLQGGAQDDILTGGTGQDTFVFRTDHGADIITDFSVGKDTLELHDATFSDLTIRKWAKGTGARVEWDEGTIYLEGVQRDALTEDSFAFV
ncbi:MAG: hypothetical protein GDA53_06570 [Rhodobacteraceae bacterium]|nr:hypothetical protein [Paracoccaceae bacterium]